MNYAAISKTTQEENQDRISFIYRHNEIIIVISDGAGGIGGGSEAAEQVVDQLSRETIQDPVEALQKLDLHIHKNAASGEATAIYIKIEKGKISGASIGDSEAWLINDGKIVNITENQRRKPLLGSGNAVPTVFDNIPFLGTLMLATDGLTKYVSMSTIRSIIEENICLNVCCEKLVELARYKSGSLPDDTTVILCKS